MQQLICVHFKDVWKPCLVPRRHFSHKLERIKRFLQHEVNDGNLNEITLKEANRVDPRLVVKAVESCHPNAWPRNESILKEYLKALAFTNSLDSRSLESLIPQQSLSNNRTNGYYQNPNFQPPRDWGSDPRDIPRFTNLNFENAKPSHVYLKTDDKNPVHVMVAQAPTSTILRVLKGLLSLGSVLLLFGTCFTLLSQNVTRGIKHNFKVLAPEDLDTTFADVKGCEEVRDELDELVEYLRNPEKFERLGAKLPKGILLAGAPGTGKTLLARAVAGEAGVAFIQASGSEFEEMFVGVGARRIRELFKLARQMAPCIVFIDELDAVGSRRSATDHNSVRMTLNQLLVELDGFKKSTGIVVLCATNFPESLDPALTRAGRLDKTIHVPLPDFKGRLDILKLYAKKIRLDPRVDLTLLARRTVGMTGADLFNVLNLAALRSSAKSQPAVTPDALEEAYDRVVVGIKGKSIANEHERKMTAYHEGGHTLVSLMTPEATKVHKATILPRGRSLGATWKIPHEKSSTRIKELHAELDVLLGGMAAEEVIYGKENVTTGCQNDLERATEIARSMVMNFGVGLDCKGPVHVDAKSYASLSQDHKSKIDAAVQSLLDEAYKRARSVIVANIDKLHNISKALVKYETLDSREIAQAIQGQIKEIEGQRNC